MIIEELYDLLTAYINVEVAKIKDEITKTDDTLLSNRLDTFERVFMKTYDGDEPIQQTTFRLFLKEIKKISSLTSMPQIEEIQANVFSDFDSCTIQNVYIVKGELNGLFLVSDIDGLIMQTFYERTGKLYYREFTNSSLAPEFTERVEEEPAFNAALPNLATKNMIATKTSDLFDDVSFLHSDGSNSAIRELVFIGKSNGVDYPLRMYYNETEGTYDWEFPNGVTGQMFQEVFTYAKVVGNCREGYPAIFNGSQGGHLLASEISEDNQSSIDAINIHPKYLMGVFTHSATNGNFVKITWFGNVNNVKTTGWYAQSTTERILYVGTNGTSWHGMTVIEPMAPHAKIVVAAISRYSTGNSSNGRIMVRPDFGYRMEELHNFKKNEDGSGKVIQQKNIGTVGSPVWVYENDLIGLESLKDEVKDMFLPSGQSERIEKALIKGVCTNRSELDAVFTTQDFGLYRLSSGDKFNVKTLDGAIYTSTTDLIVEYRSKIPFLAMVYVKDAYEGSINIGGIVGHLESYYSTVDKVILVLDDVLSFGDAKWAHAQRVYKTINGESIIGNGDFQLQPKLDEALETIDKTVIGALNEINSLAKYSNQAISYGDYMTMVEQVLLWSFSSVNGKIGQSIFIGDLNIPDLWVYDKNNVWDNYVYVSDQEIIDHIVSYGWVKIGYYYLSMLETQKVDLTNYATLTQLGTKQNTLVSESNIRSINGQSILGSGSLTIGAYLADSMPTASDGAMWYDPHVNKLYIKVDGFWIEYVNYQVTYMTSTFIDVTINTSDWLNGSATVTATGVTASNNVTISAPTDRNQFLAWGNFGISCTAQGSNTLTFVCSSTPNINFTIKVKYE